MVSQKKGAEFGFERAGLCADPDIRRWREIFRLSSKLPALAKREEFEILIENNQFVVVMGQTGSGKSTQLAQYLADMPQFEKFHVRFYVERIPIGFKLYYRSRLFALNRGKLLP